MKKTISTIILGGAILVGGTVLIEENHVGEPVAHYEIIDQQTYTKDGVTKTISDDSAYFSDLRSQIFNPTKDGKIQGANKYERYIAVEKEKQALIKELQSVKDLGMQSAQPEIDKMLLIPASKL